MPTGTIRLHRVLRANPERVYRAFTTAEAMAKWLPPYGFTCTVHHMDARVGGTYRMSFANFATGNGHSFGGEYRELVPFEKICYADRFDDPNLPGEMQTTITLKQVSCGTDTGPRQELVKGLEGSRGSRFNLHGHREARPRDQVVGLRIEIGRASCRERV